MKKLLSSLMLCLFLVGCANYNGACVHPIKPAPDYPCGRCGDFYTYSLNACAYCPEDARDKPHHEFIH